MSTSPPYIDLSVTGSVLVLDQPGGKDRCAIQIEAVSGWSNAIVELQWSTDGKLWSSFDPAITLSASYPSNSGANISGAAYLRLEVTTGDPGASVTAEVGVVYYTAGHTPAFDGTAVVGIANVVEDTTPQLGGALDAQGNNITSAGNITLSGTVDGRDVSTDGAKLDTLNASAQVPSGGSINQVLAKASGTDYDLTWAAAGSGSGDVVGPASATDNAVARFDTTTGKLVQNSAVTIDDSGNIATSGTVDGRDLSADGTKLDGIESNATADQTGAEIKTAYEAEADTNAFTDADHTKLDGIEASADVTDETNVKAALDGATTTGVSGANGDKVLILDNSDSDNLKHVLWENLPSGGGGGGDAQPVFAFCFRDILAGDELAVHVPNAITITKFNGVIDSNGTNVVFNVRTGTDRSAAGTAIEASFTVTSSTTGTELTSGFDSTAVAASAYLWVEITSISGSATWAELNIEYELT